MLTTEYVKNVIGCIFYASELKRICEGHIDDSIEYVSRSVNGNYILARKLRTAFNKGVNSRLRSIQHAERTGGKAYQSLICELKEYTSRLESNSEFEITIIKREVEHAPNKPPKYNESRAIAKIPAPTEQYFLSILMSDAKSMIKSAASSAVNLASFSRIKSTKKLY